MNSVMVNGLQRGQWSPDDLLCSLHHSLHTSVVYAIPHSDAAGQNALNNTAVEVAEDLRWHAKPWEVQPLLCFLNQLGGVECPGEVLADVDPQVSKAVHPFYFKISDKQCLVSSSVLSHVHYSLLCLVSAEGEVVVLTPCHKTGHLPPVCCFISASDPSYHCGVASELHNDVVLVGGNTVMCEQCVEDGTENTPLWGADVCYDGV